MLLWRRRLLLLLQLMRLRGGAHITAPVHNISPEPKPHRCNSKQQVLLLLLFPYDLHHQQQQPANLLPVLLQLQIICFCCCRRCFYVLMNSCNCSTCHPQSLHNPVIVSQDIHLPGKVSYAHLCNSQCTADVWVRLYTLKPNTITRCKAVWKHTLSSMSALSCGG